MVVRRRHRAPLPLLLAFLIGFPIVVAAVAVRPAATSQRHPDEVAAFVEELGAALPGDDPGVEAQRVVSQQQDPEPSPEPTPDPTPKPTPDPDSDKDRDRLTYAQEKRLGLNPNRKDTDGDGVRDDLEDPDHDGLNNWFELYRSRTDPRKEDTDKDGLHDGIEDPDDDLLSNRGEQRFKTRPHRKDTDGDGRSDWREGSSQGRRQDARAIPGSLRPRLSQATDDVPPIHDKACHSRGTSTVARSCSWTFGPRKGRKLVVLTGDSHAAHWVPALLKVAQHRGWKLVTVTKSACPVADVLKAPGGPEELACSKWRKNAWAKIQSLEPDLVIASSLDSYRFRNGAEARSRDGSAWRTGLARSLRKLGRGPARVLMLGDVYPWGAQGAVLACLRNHTRDISPCQKSRSSATASFVRGRDRVEAAAAADAGARFTSVHNILCPYDPCALVVDGILVTRDGGHISATYSREIWRALDRIIPDL
jgi:hypothetical protein